MDMPRQECNIIMSGKLSCLQIRVTHETSKRNFKDFVQLYLECLSILPDPQEFQLQVVNKPEMINKCNFVQHFLKLTKYKANTNKSSSFNFRIERRRKVYIAVQSQIGLKQGQIQIKQNALPRKPTKYKMFTSLNTSLRQQHYRNHQMFKRV